MLTRVCYGIKFDLNHLIRIIQKIQFFEFYNKIQIIRQPCCSVVCVAEKNKIQLDIGPLLGVHNEMLICNKYMRKLMFLTFIDKLSGNHFKK